MGKIYQILTHLHFCVTLFDSSTLIVNVIATYMHTLPVVVRVFARVAVSQAFWQDASARRDENGSRRALRGTCWSGQRRPRRAMPG
jgi:hypothetical protein